MLPGFNHNIRHRGFLFHVQTEDNGEKNPVIVSHLFHGGNIVASRKRNYDKFLKAAERNEIIRSMMQDQHKEMMKDLVHGRIRPAEDIMQSAPVAAPEPAPPAAPTQVPLGKRPPVPPPPTMPRPYRYTLATDAPPPTAMKPPVPTLDTGQTADKTLDELILEFLNDEKMK